MENYFATISECDSIFSYIYLFMYLSAIQENVLFQKRYYTDIITNKIHAIVTVLLASAKQNLTSFLATCNCIDSLAVILTTISNQPTANADDKTS